MVMIGGGATVNGIDKDDKRESLFYAGSIEFPVLRTSNIKVAYIWCSNSVKYWH